MKTIIVYYSMSGNTDLAAREIASRLGADTLRIEPEKSYPDKGFKKFFWGGKSAVMAETPPLRPYRFAAEDYEQVILGFPVWAGNLTPPLRTFLRDNAAAIALYEGFGFRSVGRRKNYYDAPKEDALLMTCFLK